MQEYGERAMAMLAKAVKAGYKNDDQLMENAKLDPLRDREDIKKLLEELETKK